LQLLIERSLARGIGVGDVPEDDAAQFLITTGKGLRIHQARNLIAGDMRDRCVEFS